MRTEWLWGTGAAGLMVGLLAYCSPAVTTPVEELDGGGGGGATCDDSGANCPCDPVKNKLPIDCYTGPRGTNGKGLCLTGKRSCVPDGNGGGVQSKCVGEVVPAVEICDYVDNDCNGAIDDVPGSSALSPDAGGATPIDNCNSGSCDPHHSDGGIDCYTGTARNACKAGTKVCAAGRQLTCEAFGDVVPTPEVCNGWDDDCNDQVDDSTNDVGTCDVEADAGVKFPDGGLVKGECLHSTSTCSDGGLVCPPSDPAAEKCDGKDNDCNGKADDGVCPNQFCCSYKSGQSTYGFCTTTNYSLSNPNFYTCNKW